MKKLVTILLVTCAATAVGAFASGCGEHGKVVTSAPKTEPSGDDVTRKDSEVQALVARNEGLRTKLEPYVEVVQGRFFLRPGARASGATPAQLADLQTHLSEVNHEADLGNVHIQPNRAILSTAKPEVAQAWYGLRTYWWGFEVGLSDPQIHQLLNAGRDYFSVERALKTILSGSYLKIVTLGYVSYLYLYEYTFDCCICRHSPQVIRVYWWATVTPFPNCQ